MYREDETVAVVIKLDDINTYMERAKIDPRKWTTSVTSLTRNIRNILSIKGIDKLRGNEITFEIHNAINQNYELFRDIIKENNDDSSKSSKTNNAKNQVEDNREVISNAQRLADLASRIENIELFFKNQYNEPYAAARIGNDKHLEVMPLESNKYKYYLTRLFRENTGGQIVGKDTVENAINSLAADLASRIENIELFFKNQYNEPYAEPE